jgi:phosphoglycolate phosphatase-like HAD superfamily hydrolase
LRIHDHTVPMWVIHRHIGMGGDQIVAGQVGEEVEEKQGEEIRAAEDDAYGELIGEVEPMDGARGLIEDLRDDEARVALASSAKLESEARRLVS